MDQPEYGYRSATDQLISEAEDAIIALRHFADSVMPEAETRHGIDLDTADLHVIAVESFVKAYHRLYGSPVR